MEYLTSCDAFIELTKKLMDDPFLHSESATFPAITQASPELNLAFDCSFSDKTAWKRGKELAWREWLSESGFPLSLYEKSGRDLMKMASNSEIWERNKPGKNSNHSFFGRICRPTGCGKSYLQYLIERLKHPSFRSYPNFYFDIEPCEWLWEELMLHPSQPKSSRGAYACCANMWFRMVRDKLVVGWVMKHAIWSHLYQDIFPPVAIAWAIGKEVGITNLGVSIYFCSLKMDEKRRARKFLEACK